MALSCLKNADEKTKNIIFGYSRQQQSELKLNIPMMIQYLFLMYYWIQEKFTKHGKLIEMDASCKRISSYIASSKRMDFDLYNTAYGNNVININDVSISMYKWRFKVISRPVCEPIRIGIDSSLNSEKKIDYDFTDMYTWSDDDQFYAIDLLFFS